MNWSVVQKKLEALPACDLDSAVRQYWNALLAYVATAGLHAEYLTCVVVMQHPHLPGRKPGDVTDKSDAPKGFDPNPELMEDQSNANAPANRKAEKKGQTVDQDNTISSSKSQPRKEPEDVAPEQAGS